jgi:division protein CdvB (Snf7/Vps24/ESCRT-III family)
MSKKYEIEVAQVQQKIEELQKSIRIVTSPVELESLEKEIQLLVNELGNALLGQKLQEAVDSETVSEAEKALIADHPQRFKREKKIKMSAFGADLAAR